MARRLVLAVVVATLLGFSGCVQGSGTPSQNSAAPAQGVANVRNPQDASVDVGSVDGHVLDEEYRPIVNASVSLLDLEVEVLTGADGAFLFNDVPVGTHTIVAGKPGFESQAKKVDARPRINTEVEFLLTVLAAVDPYYEVFPHNALHHAAVGIYPTWATTLYGLEYLCQGCVWTVEAGMIPKFLVLEIAGTHTIPDPTKAAAEHFWIKRDTSGGNVVLESQPTMPSKSVVNETMIVKTKKFWIQMMCEGYYHPCYEERRETWTTIFYHYEEVPETYTARPPA